jgi:uncharacterized protein
MNSASQAFITIDAARQLYERAGSGHDFDHVLRVLALARQIAAAEGADPAVVHTAALLHDVGESEGRRDHHLRGAVIAREMLQHQSPEFVEAVVHAIEAHRFRADPAPRTLEAQVVSDADKLDAIGAIGVARAFAHAGSRGTALWRVPWREIAATSTSSPPLDASTGPALLGAGYTPIHEFVFKLNRIPERLHTATARTIAAERLEFMRLFFDRLDVEMQGLEGGTLG